MSAPRKVETVVLYTTAPEGLDSYGSSDLGVVGRIGNKPVRRVAVQASRAEGQWDRWASGLYVVCDETEWQKRLGYGLAVAS